MQRSWAPPPMNGYRPMIVNVALTGAVPDKADNPTVPLTPEEIVDDVLACAEAGATVFHIHVRDEAGAPVHRRDLYERTFGPLRDKAARQAAGDLVDSLLPQPFERTAVNGFGFLQIVRPRPRASIIERVQNAPVETAALALLHLAARTPGAGPRTLTAAPRVAAWLRAHAPFVTELERRIGAQVVLAEDAALALQAGHVHAVQS